MTKAAQKRIKEAVATKAQGFGLHPLEIVQIGKDAESLYAPDTVVAIMTVIDEIHQIDQVIEDAECLHRSKTDALVKILAGEIEKQRTALKHAPNTAADAKWSEFDPGADGGRYKAP
jgi:hypothetical protein